MFKPKLTAFRRARWLAVFAGVAAVAAGVSYAAIPSADGTISACVDSHGAVKLIDAENGVTCASGKKLVTWNQQGPQGLPGQPGPQGLPGQQGAPGISGYVVVTSSNPEFAKIDDRVVLSCPAGKKPLGGGGYATSTVAAVTYNSAATPYGVMI